MPKKHPKTLYLLILDRTNVIVMRGLCHHCFRSGVDIFLSKGESLCKDCYDDIPNAKN